MEFSRDLRPQVISGDITVSYRLWQRPKVRVGGRYPVGPGQIEVDSVELVPFAAITAADVRRSGERDRAALRRTAGHARPIDAGPLRPAERDRDRRRRRPSHAGPIDDGPLLYRVEFHLVAPAG